MATPNNSTVTPSSFISLFLRANESKEIPRTGWGMHGIHDPESVAEHTYSLSFLTLQLSPILSDRLNYPLNVNKLVKMAILHDFGEIETGDIVVSRGSKIDLQLRTVKEEREKRGIKKLFKETDKSNLAVNLFSEMIERETLETKIFWQLDKLDMAIQALYYEQKEGKDLSEFFENAKAHISDEFLLELLTEVTSRRPKK
ncbi:MAG: HD domain-containing protein [Candidatus Levybacteria bacterium]|nr:HD domain-containing protein [Candidatus Levybacteria bacterium]